MGALLLYFVIGSIIAVPFLGYQLLRTRRELSELRAELRQRGVIAPGPGGQPAIPERGLRGRLARATAVPRPFVPSASQSPADATATLPAQPDIGTAPAERSE